MARSSGAPAGRAVLLATVASLLGLACAGAPQSHFQLLHVVPTRVDAGFEAGGPLWVAVAAEDPATLIQALAPEAIVATSARELVVRLDPYPARPEEPRPLHLESTFLVDFESDAVRALISAEPSGERPTPTELVAWTRRAIEASTDRGFDAASVIARRGRGDCTEHAVLFGALARSFGYPTRIAVGLVITESAGAVQAYGHAWTEVLEDDGTWQLVDPTRIEDANPVGYLPEGHLRDEGPGYLLELARIQSARVAGVRVLRAEP